MYVIGILYMFVGIAIVCDDFFVASLEAISEALQLSEDVAGRTLQAVNFIDCCKLRNTDCIMSDAACRGYFHGSRFQCT